MTDTTSLRELLERAVRLEEDAVELKEAGVLEAPAVDAGAMEADAAGGVSVAELAEKLAVLEDTIFALQNSTPDPYAAAPVEAVESPAEEAAELDDGGDFEDLSADLGEKAAPAGWGACPDCGSSNVDEFADGTARCEDCGTPLGKAEGKDFDDLELKEIAEEFDVDGFFADLEAKESDDGGDLETKASGDGDVDTLSEMELLLARRAQLDA